MKTDNELIAEFMGAVPHKKKIDYVEFPEFQFGSKAFPKDDLAYEWNWNWLMPVVEKIESSGFPIRMEGGGFFITTPKAIWTETRSDRITNCFIAIVEFIKWYNSQAK